MHEPILLPPQEVEIISPNQRLYDILEQMLKVQEHMLAALAPSMIYTTGKPKTKEPPPCPS